jgi:hypothetical protein
MYKAKLHGGKMEDCKTCTPIQKKKRERRDFKPGRQRAGTVELTIRRQMAEAVGEEELSKDARLALQLHYGLIAPRIDRRFTRPRWMTEATWKIKRQEFHNATKGLVPTYRPAQTMNPSTPTPSSVPSHHSKKWSEIKHQKGRPPRPISPQQG